MLVTRWIRVVLCTLTFAGCDGDATAPRFDPNVPGVFVRTGSDSVFLGRAMQVDAIATGPDSAEVAWPSFAWTSSDTLVAIVDASGKIQTMRTGVATITAEYNGMSDARTVRVVLERADGGVALASSSIGAGQHCALTVAGVAHCRALVAGDSVARYAILPGAQAVALAELHATTTHRCGRTIAMTLYCWGSNSQGQFLNGNRAVPPAAGSAGGANGSLTIAALTVGTTGPTSGYTCVAAQADDVVSCAGSNASQVLGRTTTTAVPDSMVAPVTGSFRARTLSVSASAQFVGEAFICAVSTTSLAHCWGGNSSGATGVGTGATPRLISGSLTFGAISSGRNHVCALTTAGVAYCWGSNGFGQLGIDASDSQTHSTPLLVKTSARFAMIASGDAHNCGVTTGGELVCWGRFPPRAMSDRYGARRNVPVDLAPGILFHSVTTDNAHICGITRDNRALCF